MEEALEGMETTRREGLESKEDFSGQEGYRAENLANSMVGDAESGWTVESGNGREARGVD